MPEAGTAPLLEVRGLTVRFGGLTALDGVDLEVGRDQISGLIGPNGAGKTTLFNAVSGLVVPSEGRILYDGRDITGWSRHRRGRAGIVRSFQRLELFSGLTVRDNLLAGWEAAARKRPRHSRVEGRQLVESVIDRLGLGPLADRVAGQLSTAQGRLVELGRALCARPRLLLLDEPSSGLDQHETARLRDILLDVAGRDDAGPAVLLVEHDVALVMEICHQITVLDFGQRIAAGCPWEVRSDPRVVAAYLGDEDVA